MPMALAGGPAVACLLVLALAVAAADGAASPAPAPAPAVDCTAEALKLHDCFEYVQPSSSGASQPPPSKACCGEVKDAINNPVAVGCLCSALSSNELSSLSSVVNVTRVLQLPAACGADPNVLTKCNHAAPPPSPAARSSDSSGGAAATPKSTTAATTTAIVVVAAVAAPLLAFFHL